MAEGPWKAKHESLLRTADEACKLSQTERVTSLDLMRTQSTDLQRTQRGVQHQLALRVDEIEARKDDLLFAADSNEAEVVVLLAYKDNVEAVIKSKENPLAVSHECVRARGQRRAPDLVSDAVDAQLAAEIALLRSVQDQFRAKHGEAVEQIRLLRAAQFQLREDLKDKAVSHAIDNGCSQLDATANVGLFRDTVRASTAGRATLPQDWEQFTSSNIARSNEEIRKSTALRAELDRMFKDTADALLAAANSVEEAFNARLAEYANARNAASQQLAKVQQEIAVQDRNVAELNDTVAARDGPLRLATTRLERRQGRPNVELVRDSAQHALVHEVGALDISVEQAQMRLGEAETTLRTLLRSELALKEDIDCKTNSINIDNACMLSRQKLKYAPL